MIVAGCVGAAAVALPLLHRPVPVRAAAWLQAVGVGIAAFAAIRFAPGFTPLPASLTAVAGACAAAIAEEALLRRMVVDRLLRFGPLLAIAAAAALFAVIHIPTHGTASVPLNLSGGLLLGWQRWATGGWSAPAATHVAANLLAFG